MFGTPTSLRRVLVSPDHAADFFKRFDTEQL
jgi:hypothetical protein